MGEEFSYDDAVAVLRHALLDAAANARAFGIRARGRPQLLSARAWAELAQIEALLARDLTDTLKLELHEEPWSPFRELRALLLGLWRALIPEPALVSRLYREASAHPVESWRAAAPQLEASLWPFFSARTRHLANATALALNEPQPHPALFWHPSRREFRS
jgi:hypothetical protein